MSTRKWLQRWPMCPPRLRSLMLSGIHSGTTATTGVTGASVVRGGAFGAARLFVEDPDSHSLFCYDTAEVPVNVCVNVYICVLSNSSSIYCVRLCVHLQSLSQLIDAMNTRGVREKFLQKQLQDRVGEIIGQIQIRQQRDGQVCDHWNVCVCAVVCDHMCIPCSTWLLCLGMQASL